jgi:hypothetical protein
MMIMLTTTTTMMMMMMMTLAPRQDLEGYLKGACMERASPPAPLPVAGGQWALAPWDELVTLNHFDELWMLDAVQVRDCAAGSVYSTGSSARGGASRAKCLGARLGSCGR